jgi:nicotinate-nucleotide pyrophosphorylase (carboxylating)
MKQHPEPPPPLHPILYEEIVNRALMEDIGRNGDITTDSIVTPEDRTTASMTAQTAGCICGLDIAAYVFRRLDSSLRFEAQCHDGTDVGPGDTIAHIRGSARFILTGERTALNFLSHLSGIATATREIVQIIAS